MPTFKGFSSFGKRERGGKKNDKAVLSSNAAVVINDAVIAEAIPDPLTFFFFCVSFCDHMSYFEDSRAHRRASRVASAFTEYVRPEDANGPSSRQVDGDVWYATMFLYPNHWEAGRGGALPLPNSPYRQLPLWSMVCQAKDYLISLAFLIMLYVVVWSLFPTMQKSVGGTF